MKPKSRIALTFAASFVFFCLLLYTIYNALYPSVSSLIHGISGMSGVVFLDNTMLVFFIALAIAILFGVNLNQFLSNRISVRLAKTELAVYFIVLFAIVFLKSRGIQETNLDVLDIYDQLLAYPASVIMNVLLFVPAGAFLYTHVKPASKALVLAFAVVVSAEAAQYMLSLGIADVVDVITNMAGICLGYALGSYFSNSGWAVSRLGDGFFKIVRTKEKRREAARRVAVTTAAFAVLTVAVTILGYPFYLQSIENRDLADVPATTDEILGSLLAGQAGPSELSGYVAEVSLPRVNGIEGRSWITVGEEGTLSASGRISQVTSWLGSDGIQYYGVAVGVVEDVDGLEVTHGVPLVVMPQTRIWIDGNQLEATDATARQAVLAESHTYDVKASFRLENGWFRPVDLFFEKRSEEDAEEFHAWFDFADYTGDTELAAADGGKPWIDIDGDEPATVEGYLDMITEHAEGESCFTMRFLDCFGSAMICHAVEIWYDDEPPSYESGLKPRINIQVRLDGDRLVYDGDQ